MSHYSNERLEDMLKERRDNKPRIRCLLNIFRVYENKAQSSRNVCYSQVSNFDSACDIVESLKCTS